MTLLSSIFLLIGRGHRSRYIWLAILGVLASLMEMFGLVLVLPMIRLLQDPSSLSSMPWLVQLQQLSGVHDVRSLMVLIAGILFSVYALKNLYFTGVYWLQRRFLMHAMSETSRMLHGYYLSAPYEELLIRNTSAMAANLRVAVPVTYYRVVLGLLNLIANVVSSVGIVAVLVFVNPMAMLMALLVAGFLVTLHLLFFGKRLEQWGRRGFGATREIYRQTRESFDLFKEIRVLGKERYFLNRLSKDYLKEAELQSRQLFFQHSVRPMTEMIVLLAIFVVLVVVLFSDQAGSELLPGLAVFAVAGVRLIPLLNQIFFTHGAMRAAQPMMQELISEIAQLSNRAGVTNPVHNAKLSFNQSLRIRDVTYVYPDNTRTTLDQVNVTIEAGQFVGIVGPSGAGKSTVMDILLGLLSPAEGCLEIDGKDVCERLAQWRQNIGYVPQSVEITHDSLRANVAFGVPPQHIDDARVVAVLESVGLSSLLTELDIGLSTPLGDGGVRLSGGQRKRVGIARALYRDPQVLVLDEATADLDNETEHALTKTLLGFRGQKTIVVIAHRLISVEKCDRVFFMRDGRVVSSGEPQQLYRDDPSFAEFVRYGQHQRLTDNEMVSADAPTR